MLLTRSLLLYCAIGLRHPRAFPIRAICFDNATPNFFDNDRGIDYKRLAVIKTEQLKNLYKHKSNPPCQYCHGSGYTECYYCNKGCWRCKQTTLLECPFCSGDGESRPAYSTVPVD